MVFSGRYKDYIKGDRTKHISPKLFYTHKFQKIGEIDVQQIRSSNNLAYMFRKSLLTSTFRKLIYKIGMHQPKDIDTRGSIIGCYCTALIFLRPDFVSLGFTGKVFNEIVLTNFLKFHNRHSRGGVIRKSVNDTQTTKRMLVTFAKQNILVALNSKITCRFANTYI